MKLMNLECYEEHTYKLEFMETIENHLVTIRVEFKEHWRLTSSKKDLLNDFGNVVGFFLKGDMEDFPYDSKKNLASIPLHIPHPLGRQIFKECMDFYTKEAQAPMHTTFSDQVVVTFDKKILTEEVTDRVVTSIMAGIRSAKTEKKLIEVEEIVTDDTLDEVDEDVIVEFEFDEELKSIMKEPISKLIQPIGGGMENA